MEDRVLKQARKLPMGRTLTAEEIDGVRGDYARYTSTHAVFDAQAAKETGLSASTISQWRGKCYKGDDTKVARVVNDWMEADARRRQAELPSDYVQTTVAEQMNAVCTVACSTNSMAAIVAPSGSGKTLVMQVLCDKHRGRYIYCTEDLTPRAFLVKLAKAVETSHTHRNTAELMDAIVERMHGTNRSLFLDEAHRLRPIVLPRIRSVHDQAGVPIILAGTHEILNRVNDRSDGRG
jgi:DNA transposition AAA+ family ATPase